MKTLSETCFLEAKMCFWMVDLQFFFACDVLESVWLSTKNWRKKIMIILPYEPLVPKWVFALWNLFLAVFRRFNRIIQDVECHESLNFTDSLSWKWSKGVCPKGYCVREIQTGSRIKMCESCVCVSVRLVCTFAQCGFLESEILTILAATTRRKIAKPCSSCLD